MKYKCKLSQNKIIIWSNILVLFAVSTNILYHVFNPDKYLPGDCIQNSSTDFEPWEKNPYLIYKIEEVGRRSYKATAWWYGNYVYIKFFGYSEGKLPFEAITSEFHRVICPKE